MPGKMKLVDLVVKVYMCVSNCSIKEEGKLSSKNEMGKKVNGKLERRRYEMPIQDTESERTWGNLIRVIR
jgi:hypothetical protein